jgi:hypothetical protein
MTSSAYIVTIWPAHPLAKPLKLLIIGHPGLFKQFRFNMVPLKLNHVIPMTQPGASWKVRIFSPFLCHHPDAGILSGDIVDIILPEMMFPEFTLCILCTRRTDDEAIGIRLQLASILQYFSRVTRSYDQGSTANGDCGLLIDG